MKASEDDDLDRADIILKGRSPSGDECYVVGEISVTIDDDNVDQAARRAQILKKASGGATHPAVIGAHISDANRERALSANVAVITLNE